MEMYSNENGSPRFDIEPYIAYIMVNQTKPSDQPNN